jgi:hypothetical protein
MPISIRLGMDWFLQLCGCRRGRFGGCALTLSLDGLNPGDQSALLSQFTGGIEPFGLRLQAQTEQVFGSILQGQLQMLVAHVA